MLLISGQSVQLSLPFGSTLVARYLGDGNSVDVPNGSHGVVVAVLDVSSSDTLAAVKFDGYDFDLKIPTKYLKVLS